MTLLSGASCYIFVLLKLVTIIAGRIRNQKLTDLQMISKKYSKKYE